MSKNILVVKDDLSLFEERCDEIVLMKDYQSARAAVSQLRDTLKANPNIIALAAPQIGIHQRVFVARFGKELKAFMNPIVVKTSKEEFLSEEEFVFTNRPKRFLIHRPGELVIAFQDVNGEVQQMTFKKMTVCPILQMIDLLDGVLKDVLYYTALELDKSWDRKTKKEKQEIISNFESMVKENAKKFAKEMESDETLQAIQRQVEFNKQYLTGQIKPVDKDGNIIETEKKE